MLKEYLSCEELTSEFEQEVKQAVKRAGGQVNCSGLFLSTTFQALDVKSKPSVGVNRRSVLQLPRSKVPPEPLKLLDKCISARRIIIFVYYFRVLYYRL